MTDYKMSNTQAETEEIDLRALLAAVLRKSWLIALVAVVCAGVMFLYTAYMVTPLYQSSTKFYVNNKAGNKGESSVNVSSGDLTASRYLVDSYIGILKTRETLNAVIEYAGEEMNYKTLQKMISAKAVDNTEIFQVTVESDDPKLSEKLADAIAHILPQRIAGIIDGTSVKIVEEAVEPTEPSSPSYVKNVAIGVLIGLVASVGVIVLKTITDTTIREDKDVAQVCHYPILAAVPDMNAVAKVGKYYGYDRKKGGEKKNGKKPVLVGGDISFAASEAYKLLRTKLQFSFAGEAASRVITVTSALSGEGKSLSSTNLACSLSELGKKVILVDCDMRRPTLAEKMGLRKTPGLSSYLTGQSDLESLVQTYVVDEEKSFYVVSAGHNPPNPNELLGSERMREGLNWLRSRYDYIILDMPPVGEVSDAMSVIGQIDGTLLVVREDYCDRRALADAVHQFDYVNAKILGVVVNCANDHMSKYGKRYYKKYDKMH